LVFLNLQALAISGSRKDPECVRNIVCVRFKECAANVERLSYKEAMMFVSTPDFTLEIEGIKGVCSAGEVYARKTMAEKKIPIFSCEGPCIRGDIARRAANMVAHEVPSFARACHARNVFCASLVHGTLGERC
jgi:hypothetical protein